MLTLLVQGPRWVPDLATISPGPCEADSWDSDSDPEAALCLPWSRNSSSLWSCAPRGPPRVDLEAPREVPEVVMLGGTRTRGLELLLVGSDDIQG